MLTTLPIDALRSRHQPVSPLSLALDRGLVLTGALTVDARAVEDARDAWTPAFDATQFTLGRAYYTHLEEGEADTYFEQASSSNALVERIVPGLSQSLLSILSRVIGAPVVQREGWCGAGIHVFPANGWVAERGGEVHFDIEGLDEAQLDARARALTIVLGIQAPEEGGGLRLWPRRYDGTDETPDGDPITLPMRAGDVVVFDSYRLHQIEPFEGGVDRMTATVHAIEDGERWLAWF